jgi:arylsulfatase A-like enzyme
MPVNIHQRPPSTSPSRGIHRLLTGALLILLLAADLGCGELNRSKNAEARHIVLLVLDTVRADRLSVYGYRRDTTPYLRDLAKKSVLYTRAKAPAPWTVPSHASLLTGLWPAEHQAQWGRTVLLPEHLTLAEMLAGHGFRTVGLSSNAFVDTAFGLAQGFEEFRFFDLDSAQQTRAILQELPGILDTTLLDERRLFLFVNLMDAHIPYNISVWGDAYGVRHPLARGRHQLKWSISAGEMQYPAKLRQQQNAAYDAALRYLDDAVREIVGMLTRRELLDDTLLIVTSDHGEGLGDHPELGHSISLWEEQLAVPLLVRYPGARGAGSTATHLTSLVATTPTVLDELGLPRPSNLEQRLHFDHALAAEVSADYRSYFSELKRKKNTGMAQRHPELAARVEHAHAVYCGENKYVVDAAGSIYLFDLATDARELTNLAAQQGEPRAACERSYRELTQRGRFTPFDDTVNPEQLQAAERAYDEEKLRALGYVQ